MVSLKQNIKFHISYLEFRFCHAHSITKIVSNIMIMITIVVIIFYMSNKNFVEL